MSVRNQKDRERLGRTVQKYRRQTGLSQEEFASKIHASRTHLGHIEQGRKSPSFELLGKIARALRVKIKDLLP